jgi:simple sugar transport system permease protein
MSRFGRIASATKLYWGLLAVIAAGAFLSPVSFDGTNVFLSASNLTDVLRQVSITGIIAVGMTLVIHTGGIDLSVGSVMALGATLVAMLLTQQGWHNAAVAGVPATMLVLGGLAWAGVSALLKRRGVAPFPALAAGAAAGAVLAAGAYLWLTPQLGEGVGLLGVIIAALAVGLVIGGLNGLAVAKGGLQPFIATLAAMVAVLGLARLMAGQDQSVYPIYSGTEAAETFGILRSSVFGIPVPGLLFVAVVVGFALLLSRFRFGREIYAIGGNEKAAHLAGVNVARVKITVYALSGMLAAFAGVLYAAQYRQGKPDAGVGLELDAIAAVVIGGASLMGGRGTVQGTLVGVLIFGLLTNVFQLSNVDSNTQLVLKGLIIIAAVLVQEGKGLSFARFRRKSG